MTHRKREYQHLSVIMCGEYFRDDTQFFFFFDKCRCFDSGLHQRVNLYT